MSSIHQYHLRSATPRHHPSTPPSALVYLRSATQSRNLDRSFNITATASRTRTVSRPRSIRNISTNQLDTSPLAIRGSDRKRPQDQPPDELLTSDTTLLHDSLSSSPTSPKSRTVHRDSSTTDCTKFRDDTSNTADAANDSTQQPFSAITAQHTEQDDCSSDASTTNDYQQSSYQPSSSSSPSPIALSVSPISTPRRPRSLIHLNHSFHSINQAPSDCSTEATEQIEDRDSDG